MRSYGYSYPRNLISWFFLAQRHGYVRRILHNSNNLDIGCGLYKITNDSVGLDIRGWKSPDKVGSALSIPFPENSFDTVTLLEVIEHYKGEEQGRILQEIRRVLKHRGQLVLSMPNISKFWAIPYRIIWWLWERSVQSEYLHEHVGMIRREELLKLLVANGFLPVSVRRVALLDLVVGCVNNK